MIRERAIVGKKLKYNLLFVPLIIGEDIIEMVVSNTDKYYNVKSIRDRENRDHDYWTKVYPIIDGEEKENPIYIDFYDTRESMLVGHKKAVEYVENNY